jgi:hypothetical protein
LPGINLDMQSFKVLSAPLSSANFAALSQSIKDNGLAANVTDHQEPNQALNALLEDDSDCTFLFEGSSKIINFDDPLLLAEGRPGGIQYHGEIMQPPPSDLWG